MVTIVTIVTIIVIFVFTILVSRSNHLFNKTLEKCYKSLVRSVPLT